MLVQFTIMIYLLIAIVICLVIFLYRIKRLEQRVFKPLHLKPYKKYETDDDDFHIRP